MPELSKGLIDALLDHLGQSELAMRISAELAQARSNAPEDIVRIEVPYAYVPHVADAFAVGAAKSMMCRESLGARAFQAKCAKTLFAQIPDTLQIYLHRSERAEIFGLLRDGAEVRFEPGRWGRSAEISYHTPDRKASFTLSRIGDAAMKDEVAAKSAFEGIAALALRLRPEGPLARNEGNAREADQDQVIGLDDPEI